MPFATTRNGVNPIEDSFQPISAHVIQESSALYSRIVVIVIVIVVVVIVAVLTIETVAVVVIVIAAAVIVAIVVIVVAIRYFTATENEM